MSTRAYIILKTKDGKYRGVYNHFDGYLSGIGFTLKNFYTNYEKVEQLIALGNLSAVGEKIEAAPVVTKYGFDWRYNDGFQKLPESEQIRLANHVYDNYTLAYARDRGEKLEYTEWSNIEEIYNSFKGGMIEYVYLFSDNHWHYYCTYKHTSFHLLTDEAIDGDKF